MYLQRKTKCLIAGPAAVVMIQAAVITFAQSGQASHPCEPGGVSRTVSAYGGNYKAIFQAYGENLIVENHATDGYAAVVYAKVYSYTCDGAVPLHSTMPIDEDRHVASNGYAELNPGTPDGSGDIREGYQYRFRV